jgi:hypothetical protein
LWEGPAKVNTEDRSIVEASHGTPLSNPQAERAVRRPLAIAGGVGALAGLLIGILVGRATVSTVSEPVSSSQKALKEKPPKAAKAPPEEPLTPPDAYRAELGRRLGKDARGFDKEVIEKRPAARIVGPDATLHFPFKAPEGKSYALTAVVQLDGTTTGKLQANLDGRPVGTWELSKGWGLYSSPPDGSVLAADQHDVAFAPTNVGKDGAVRVDSIAVVPVEDELSFAVGAESRGHLIDGFSKTEARSVWSEGPRSVIGGVLAPLADSAYKAIVRCSAYPPIEPIEVRLSVNGKDVGTATVTRRVRDASWAIPPKLLRSGPNLFTLDYPKTGQPAKLKPGSTDERELAVRIFAVDVVPRD